MSLTLRWIQRAGILGRSAARPGSLSEPDPAATGSLTSRLLTDNCSTALVCFQAHRVSLQLITMLFPTSWVNLSSCPKKPSKWRISASDITSSHSATNNGSRQSSSRCAHCCGKADKVAPGTTTFQPRSLLSPLITSTDFALLRRQPWHRT